MEALQKLQEEQKKLLTGIEHPRLGNTLGFFEEVGELAEELMEIEVYNGSRQEELEDEAADVLFSLFSICDSYNVDLQSVYSDKRNQGQSLADVANIKLGNILSLFRAVGVLSKEIMEIEMYNGLRQKELEDKVAGFFSSLLSVCDLYKIDLLVAYSRKIEKISKKIPKWHKKYGASLKQLREKFD